MKFGDSTPLRGHARATPDRIVDSRTGGLLVALLLLTLVAAAAFLSWQEYVHFADSTRRSNETISRLHSLILNVREAESGQRGYLLTSDRQYLSDYDRALSAVHGNLAALHNVSPDAHYRRTLDSLTSEAAEKLAELAGTIRLDGSGHRDAAIDEVKSNRGRRIMEAIVSLGGDLENQLRVILRKNRERSRFFAAASQYVTVLGCAGIFVLVYLSNRRIRRLLSTSAHLNENLANVNADLRQFVYSASHDLREPLRTITIYSEAATKKARENRPFDLDLRFVRDAGKLMTAIVDGLLLYTQALSDESPGDERADLNKVVDQVCNTLQVSIGDAGAQVTHSELQRLPLSEPHAYLLIQNLVANAVKYRSEATPKIRIETRRDSTNWLLTVSDNGIGIEPKYHEYVFGLFKRLHSRDDYPGTGLGLAICKKIVERYGGTISVESELGQGSTFQVTLPAERRSAA